jgi:regulator of protease activity HflC (stomatin/prohibitin superfamily)
MQAAFEWIGKIADWIGQWIPRWQMVNSTHAYVKYEGFFLPSRWRRFKDDIRVTRCDPGIFWWWPATTNIDHYPTVYQSDNLPSQTFETEDGVSITVGAIVSYTVTDVVTLLTGNQNAVKTIEVESLAAIHQVCCRMKYAELREEQRRRTLGTKLRNEAQRGLDRWGVKVEDCRLTDLTRTKALRLIQSTQSDTA